MNKNVYLNLSVKNLFIYNIILYILIITVDYFRIDDFKWSFVNTIDYGVQCFYFIFLSLIFYLIIIKYSEKEFKFKEYFKTWLMSILFMIILLGFLRDVIVRIIDTFFMEYGYFGDIISLITSLFFFVYPFVVIYLASKYFSKRYKIDWKYISILILVLMLFEGFILIKLSPYIYLILYPMLSV